jgi:F0F1-type ATP synthase gamma subunit
MNFGFMFLRARQDAVTQELAEIAAGVVGVV